MWQSMSFGPLFIQPTNSLAILLGGKSLPEIQEIALEIGMLGKYGLDINDPQESHVRGRCRDDFPCAGISPLLSTFFLFYFPWRQESVGSNKFYGIFLSLK